MEKMKAVVAYGTKDFRYEDVDKPVAGPGDVIIKIEAAGICAGDRVIYYGTAPWGELPGPTVLGHEYVGTVVELGEQAEEETGLALGDRCLAEIQIPCWKCHYCKNGLYHLCTDESGFLEGGWAEYMKLRRGAVIHKVPASIDKLSAAMIEPLSCSAHAVERANIHLKDTVVISGLGAIGQGMLQFVKLKTPYRIIGLDISDELLEIAKAHGAEYVFNPTKVDVEAEIKALTGGIGADIFLEASGNGNSINTGMKVLRKRGRLVVYGVYTKETLCDFNYVSEYKELEIFGGHLSPDTYPFVIKCLEKGLIDTKHMVTDIYKLNQIEEAINAKAPGHISIKTVLVP